MGKIKIGTYIGTYFVILKQEYYKVNNYVGVHTSYFYLLSLKYNNISIFNDILTICKVV